MTDIPEVLYGIPITNMSDQQIYKAMNFSMTVEPWLNANIGEFGKDWFVELDKEFNSLRLYFKDNETEVYFKLAWLHGAKEDYEVES